MRRSENVWARRFRMASAAALRCASSIDLDDGTTLKLAHRTLGPCGRLRQAVPARPLRGEPCPASQPPHMPTRRGTDRETADSIAVLR